MIDPLSLIPLHIETYFDNKDTGEEVKIADATAFVYAKNNRHYIISNWHVFSGRDPYTNQPESPLGAIPNFLYVWFPAEEEPSAWVRCRLELREAMTDKPLWLEHPNGREIDVAALPWNAESAIFYPLKPEHFNRDLYISPSEIVSIIGFPFGIGYSGSLPIWKTGHVASDIDADVDAKPMFLIDATNRHGMSGSPVIARRKEFISEDKRILISLQEKDRFLGIFSGNITKYDTEIGMVWKPHVIDEIIDNSNTMGH